MIYEIQELVQSIHEHARKNGDVDEVLFYLLVELGRVLERNRVENFTPDFLSKKIGVAPNLSEQNKIKRINEILHQIVLRAHVGHITSSGPLSYSCEGGSFLPELTEEIQKKHGISYRDARRAEDGLDLVVTFSINGKLRRIFEENEFEPIVHTNLLSSSGDTEEIISTETRAEKVLYDTFVDFDRAASTNKIGQIDSLLLDLERFYLFYLISSN